MASTVLGLAASAAAVLYACSRISKGLRRRAKRERMRGKVAIVTGASSGIGKALAERLAKRGYQLTLAARGMEELRRTAAELGDCHCVSTDITDAKQCEALVAAVLKEHGRLDLLVACAGTGHHGLAHNDDPEKVRQVMEVNFFGQVNCIRSALPHLLRYEGELLVVSSVSGVLGAPLRTAYCASKYALEGYLAALRVELQMLGDKLPITVSLPSSVDTNFRKHNLGPRPKMTASRCADITIAGWEAGAYRVFVPAKLGWLTAQVFPQAAIEWFVRRNQRKLFNEVVAHEGK